MKLKMSLQTVEDFLGQEKKCVSLSALRSHSWILRRVAWSNLHFKVFALLGRKEYSRTSKIIEAQTREERVEITVGESHISIGKI